MMARYIDADKFECAILHEDIEIAKHKCKDFESYIGGAEQFRFQVKNAISKQPTADVVEVKHGEWKVHTETEEWLDDTFTFYTCSLCGRENALGETAYCPHCGAKMDGGKAE